VLLRANILTLAILTLGVCSAADVYRGVAVDDPIAVESYLRGRLVFWKARLQLDDWSVALQISQTGDLRQGTLGNIHWDPEEKTAVIRVLDTPRRVSDMECTIVHELVHLELASLPRTENSRVVEEGVVNRLANALLRSEYRDWTVQ
jgi:hypothetical protein